MLFFWVWPGWGKWYGYGDGLTVGVRSGVEDSDIPWTRWSHALVGLVGICYVILAVDTLSTAFKIRFEVLVLFL